MVVSLILIPTSLIIHSDNQQNSLGHNGAGKTTTINMLTGALSPTSGYATVAGKDIRTQLPQIRKDIGICLQHDCLFPLLTVREHVQFFARVKGLYSNHSHREAEDMIDQSIRDVALMEKRHTLSKNLSGGMKRKLSVAIAFCGGSKVVLLDEPTSGKFMHEIILCWATNYYCDAPPISFFETSQTESLLVLLALHNARNGSVFSTIHLGCYSSVSQRSLHYIDHSLS